MPKFHINKSMGITIKMLHYKWKPFMCLVIRGSNEGHIRFKKMVLALELPLVELGSIDIDEQFNLTHTFCTMCASRGCKKRE